MGDNDILITFNTAQYHDFLRKFSPYTQEEKKNFDKVHELLQQFVVSKENRDDKYRIRCDSPTSLYILAIKLSRIGHEEPADNLEESVSKYVQATLGVIAEGFSHIPVLPVETRKERKSTPVNDDLEKEVIKAMNSIYLCDEKPIDIRKNEQLLGSIGQHYARNYLIKLLIGVYDTLDESVRTVNKSHQLAVYDGLRAYLPFRKNDQLFLFKNLFLNNKDNPELIPKDPDWPIADNLISRVKGTKEYTNIQMARLPFIVLVNDLRQMKGYKQHQKKIESGVQKDDEVLDYVNQTLKTEVLLAARSFYKVPIIGDD